LNINKAVIAPESQFGQEMIHRINTDVDLISRAYTIDLQDQALERYSPVRINSYVEHVPRRIICPACFKISKITSSRFSVVTNY